MDPPFQADSTCDHSCPRDDYIEEHDDSDVDAIHSDVSSIDSNIALYRPRPAKHSSYILRSDAALIVGGQSLYLSDGRTANHSHTAHPKARPDEPTENQEYKVAGFERDHKADSYERDQKVFLFLLPFGGFLSFTKHIPKFSVPMLESSSSHSDKELMDDVHNRLAKQQLISTLDDARYFNQFAGVDNVRMRAVKHTLTNSVNGVVPGFIKRDKPHYEQVFHDLTGNIVLLGGYRGLVLRDATTHKRVWVPLTAGLKLRRVNLLLGPLDEDELRAGETIVADGVLKNVGPIDICKKLLKKLNNGKTNVHEFGYDWRLSGDLISARLIKFLEQLKRETGEPTIVIGHLMGGIMAHGAVQQRPDLFRGILYVGAPLECLNILGPIRYGDNVIMSDKVLTFETNFMMRSSFNFLPPSGRLFCNLETNEYYDLDYFDPETWVEYNLNPLVAKKRRDREQRHKLLPGTLPQSLGTIQLLSTMPLLLTMLSAERKDGHFGMLLLSHALKIAKRKTSLSLLLLSLSPQGATPAESDEEDEEEAKYHYSFSESYDYLCRTLKRTKKYMDGLQWDPALEDKYPPMAVVYGNKVPSVRGLNVQSKQDIKDGNYYEFFYGHGDGVIHQKWLLPERKGFRFYDEATGTGEIVGKFPSDCGHVDLMTDFKTMGEGLHAIIAAEKVWKLRHASKTLTRATA